MKIATLIALLPTLLASAAEQISVEMCNLANAPKFVILGARADTAHLFRDIGVIVKWVDCGTPTHPGAAAPLFTVRVLNSAPARLAGSAAADVLGLAYLASDGHSVFADVYYDAVQHFGERERVNADETLGYAIAHELGHLLLGPRHGRRGIMSASWSLDDLRAMLRHKLTFSAEDGVSIHRQLQGKAPGPALAQLCAAGCR